jgi:hypothetical protein
MTVAEIAGSSSRTGKRTIPFGPALGARPALTETTKPCADPGGDRSIVAFEPARGQPFVLPRAGAPAFRSGLGRSVQRRARPPDRP